MAPMSYRAVLATPGVRALTIVGFLARVPASGSAIILTLHVVLTMRLGYGPAGLVGAASTVGMTIGAPLMGRLIDRRGLRTMLVLTILAEGTFWGVAPQLSYAALVVGAFLGGVLGLPVHSVIRQSVAVMAPGGMRRSAFALDAMAVEISYIVGPAAGAVLALQLSTPVAMWLVGAAWVGAGLALWALNPPTRAPETAGGVGPARSWLTVRLGGALLATTGSVFVLYGTELVMIAGLQTSGQTAAIPVVNTVWCLASLSGGFAYGLLRRSLPLAALVGALALATVPVSLGGPWWTFALLLIPAGMLCAPSLAASAETVSALAPEHARGLVTGLQGSAISIGAAMAAPLTGTLIDTASPGTAVLVVAAGGAAAATAAGLLMRGRGLAQPAAATVSAIS